MVIKDRLLDESDGWPLHACNNLDADIAYYDWKRRTQCALFAETGLTSTKSRRHTFKLLLDEMKSLGVAMRMELEDQR